MTRAITTFATGEHEQLLDIAWPSFEAFADRHGYELIRADLTCDRAPSWWKVPILMQALEEFTEVLHLDADTVIVDPSADLEVPVDAWQAMVEHSTHGHRVPNCGVWLVRRPMVPILERVWEMTEYVDHAWWEQAAVLTLMGYEGAPLHHDVFTQPVHDTELQRRTFFLDPSWNVHINHSPADGRSRIEHATMHPDRVAVMQGWAAQAAGALVAA